MFILTKGMGLERHMVLLISSFEESDHIDQMLNCISNQEGQIFKMVHQDVHGLNKLAIMNGND